MSTSVNRLQTRTLNANGLLGDIVPSAFTLATMLRHRKMAAWLREEFDGYRSIERLPPYRCKQPVQVEVNSPSHGWAKVPINADTIAGLGCFELYDSARVLEQVYLNCKSGGGHRTGLSKDVEAVLQQELSARAVNAFNQGSEDDGWRPYMVGTDLSFFRQRDVYRQVLRTVRASIYLWCEALLECGIGGEHNSYSASERQAVEHLNEPEIFWASAMEKGDVLPVPDTRDAGFLERVLGRRDG